MELMMEPTLESAIPSHLRCPRSRHRRVPDDCVPPYPSSWPATRRA